MCIRDRLEVGVIGQSFPAGDGQTPLQYPLLHFGAGEDFQHLEGRLFVGGGCVHTPSHGIHEVTPLTRSGMLGHEAGAVLEVGCIALQGTDDPGTFQSHRNLFRSEGTAAPTLGDVLRHDAYAGLSHAGVPLDCFHKGRVGKIALAFRIEGGKACCKGQSAKAGKLRLQGQAVDVGICLLYTSRCV